MTDQEHNRSPNRRSQKERIKELTEKLEEGVKAVFESDRYKEYLACMSKFHNYSLNNCLLISAQYPAATAVAGYRSWQQNFGRQVRKGEKAIKILAPCKYKVETEEKDENGDPKMMELTGFRVVSVFALEQTEGKELPSIGVDELSGDVRDYHRIFNALISISPVPVRFEEIEGGAKGYYHDCRETYQMMREVSDRICREHGLSTIDRPRGRGVNQYLYKMEQAGMPTRHNVARQAIDEAVALSVNMEEFKAELRKRGYLLHFDPSRKYWGLVPPGWKKTIRIHKLGNEYTRERIEERIADNDISIRAVRLRQQYHIPNNYSLKRRIDRIMGRSGLEKLYLRYCYELGYLPKYRQSPTKLHIALKEDLLKCDQYSEQAKLLSRYHISTVEDLSLHEAKVEEKMADIMARRDELRRKARRVLPEEEITEIKDQIKALTSELKRLRREVKVCGQIRERSGHVRENLATIDRDRQKQKEQER